MPRITYVREITEDERKQLQAGLRLRDSFVVKRCQILLASERRESPPAIARNVGCGKDTVLKVIKGFNTNGLEVLKMGSRRPHKTQAAFTPTTAAKLKEILHQSPRNFGKETSRWTLDLAAEVSFENDLVAERVTGETIRATLKRLGVKWSRAKHWITSPDPEYERKKSVETG
jgi:transposase